MTPKTRNLLKTMIGKDNGKSAIPRHFKLNNDIITNPNQISNAFCNLFLQMSAQNTQIRDL